MEEEVEASKYTKSLNLAKNEKKKMNYAGETTDNTTDCTCDRSKAHRYLKKMEQQTAKTISKYNNR